MPTAGSARIRYLHRSPVKVQGPVTGIHYYFSGAEADQAVDHRDAPGLVATGYFRAV